MMASTSSNNLQTAARSLLESATRTVTFESTGRKYTFCTPCSDGLETNEHILESSTVLIAARALCKLGRSDEAWSFLRTLFSSQSTTHGFMPKFVYLNESYGDDLDNIPEFIGPYPGPKLFKGNEYYYPSYENVRSSNTIMAPPYHATTILEVFYLSNQTNVDVDHLIFFYDKLRSWHEFLHDQVVTKCIEVEGSSSSGDSTKRHRKYHPCVLVRHPWETEVDMQSPIWGTALNLLKEERANLGWNPSFNVPDAVKATFDYPGDEVYNSLLYLLQCLSSASNDDMKESLNSNEHIQSACPFSMIDVGFTAALAKSDQDFKQIQQILMDKNRISYSQRETDIAQTWIQTSKQMLNALWNENYGIFFNRIVELEPSSDGTYSSNKTTEIDVAAAYNFNSLWAPLANSTMVEHMTTQIVQHAGTFSFGCGDFAVWSIGGCDKTHHSGMGVSPVIVPVLNYRIARGLKRNEASLEQYIQTSTLNLICGEPNSDESNLLNCSNIRFASAFNASTTQSIGTNGCDLTSTMAASIVLDLLSADKPFRYNSEPPISSSSVIILIAIEMILAMAIGLNCLILSLNLVRRANVDEEGDSFFRIDTDQHETMEQELLVQSPGLSEGYDASMAGFDETYPRPSFEMLGWSTGILARLNPLNLLRDAPVSNVEDANQQKP